MRLADALMLAPVLGAGADWKSGDAIADLSAPVMAGVQKLYLPMEAATRYAGQNRDQDAWLPNGNIQAVDGGTLAADVNAHLLRSEQTDGLLSNHAHHLICEGVDLHWGHAISMARPSSTENYFRLGAAGCDLRYSDRLLDLGQTVWADNKTNGVNIVSWRFEASGSSMRFTMFVNGQKGTTSPFVNVGNLNSYPPLNLAFNAMQRNTFESGAANSKLLGYFRTSSGLSDAEIIAFHADINGVLQ